VSRDLARDQLLAAIQSLAYLTGADETPSSGFPAALRWMKARWDAGDDFLPFVLVHDLGHLLLRGRDFRFASSRALGEWPDTERALRLAYEDRLLGRWALDASARDAHVAIAGMPERHRDTAIAHALGLAIGRPLRNVDRLARGNPAHLRALLQDMPSVWTDVPEGLAERRELVTDAWLGWATTQLQACIDALEPGRLFSEEDLWEIAHLPDLPSESTRLALREIHEAVRRIGQIEPGPALEVRRRAQEVPVEATAADRYPTGGFDAISTKGVFENLVRTEIVYVGEGVHGGIDMFDVRWVEGELLYYTRDESPLLDARRSLTLVIDRPAELRHKLPQLPAQTLVLVEALCLVLQADLVRVFGPAAAHVRVMWRTSGEHDEIVAEEELGLVGLSLKAEVAHRRAALEVTSSWRDVPDNARVIFSPHSRPQRVAEEGWVRVGDPVWRIGGHAFDASQPDRLRELATHLLNEHVA
jgi:hypothetical protein